MSKKTNLAVAIAVLTTFIFCNPQTTSARDRRFFDSREHLSEQGRGFNRPLFKKRDRDGGRDVIPAPNGNTGINGSGLPKRMKKPWKRPGRVIPAPNGNTGINGSGLPR